ncbi:LacI family DNA-binding transcriptional regulator [Actinoplanes sp. CA-030573]|uniref:LacI family DNA-binding transcriptional regulator n=1 Tax=Actinoplanes sp. CA-030573 TaxID=3239898 RepID=UPI003D8C9936
MRTGERRPTLADVAAEAGVSVALASIVMREAPGASAATRARVLEVARRLGYQPDSRARLLRSGESRLLGVVFGVQHPFHDDVLTGLYDAAGRVGHELALSAVTPRRDERTAIDGLLRDRCAALILLGPLIPTAELGALTARMPVVAMFRPIRHKAVDVVRTDDSRGLHLAVDHLVELGHRRIAHVDGARWVASAERRQGYREAMTRHGLAEHIRVVPGGSGEEDGARAARELLDDPPTAVTTFNDLSATGLLDGLRRGGLDVPGDISVVGYDDSSFSRLAHIDLTTVAQDIDTMTTLAVARAVERVAGVRIAHREVVTSPRLVVRGTTGPVDSGSEVS